MNAAISKQRYLKSTSNGLWESSPFISPVPGKQYPIQSIRRNNMSRTATTIFSAATTANISAVPAVTSESLGVTGEFNTLEVRGTIVPMRDDRIGQESTLFVFHGGRVMYSKKSKSHFLSFMPRPFQYKKGDAGAKGGELMVNEKTGDLVRSSVKSLLVRKTDLSLPEELKAVVTTLKSIPLDRREEAMSLLALTGGIDVDAVRKHLAAGADLEYRDISPAEYLPRMFGHENVTFKANIPSRWEDKLESIVEMAKEGGVKYSIVLRFDMSRVNMAKEPVELSTYKNGVLEPRRHPITGKVIEMQEVILPLTYLGYVKGSTYEEDSSKYMDPERVMSALLSSTKSNEKKVYMDQSIIDERAARINRYKEELGKATGKKWFKKSGIADELYSSEVKAAYASGDTGKAEVIFSALAEDERVEESHLASIKSTFLKQVDELKVEQASSPTPEPEAPVSEVDAASEAAVQMPWGNLLANLSIGTDKE